MVLGEVAKAFWSVSGENNVTIQNTFWYRYFSSIPSTDAAAFEFIREHLVEAIWEALRTAVPQTATLISIIANIVDADGEVIRILGQSAENVPGTVVTSPYLNATVAGVGWIPTTAPRTRGRKQFGPFSEGADTAGLLNSATTARTAAAVAEWLKRIPTGIAADVLEPGVLSSKGTGFVAFGDVGFVTNLSGNQRSRRVNRGI